MMPVILFDSLQTTSRWVSFPLQLLFLVYYQSILGYILTLVLRISIRFGLVRFTRKKNAKLVDRHCYINEGSSTKGESWKIETNSTSLIEIDPLSWILKLKYFKRNERNQGYGHDGNDFEPQDDDDGNIKEYVLPQDISVDAVIPSCSIPKVRLSPFIRLQGQTRRRTYLLGISFEKLQFQLNVSLRIKEEDQCAKGHNVDVKVNLDVTQVQLYLFSQGVIPFFVNWINNLFRKKSPGDDINTNRKGSQQRFLLHFIPKVIGGIDVIDLKLSSSIQASSYILRQGYNYEITTKIKTIRINLESIADQNYHKTDERNAEHRICSLSVVLESCSANLIDHQINAHRDDENIATINLKKVFFVLKVNESSPAKMQLHTYKDAKIEVAISFEETIRLIEMISVFIPNILHETLKNTHHQAIVTNNNGHRNENIVLEQNKNAVLETFSINSEIKLTYFDDRTETTSIFGKTSTPLLKKIEFSSCVSIEGFHALNGTNLSIVVPKLRITSKKQMNVPGKLQLDLKDAAFTMETSSQSGGNDFFLDLDTLLITSDCKFETDYMIGVVLHFHKSIRKLVQGKTTQIVNKPLTTPGSNPPFTCFGIACKDLTLGVHLPSLENQLSDVGILLNFILNGVLVSITPPDNLIEVQSGTDGETNIEIANAVASATFVPHQTFPKYEDCLDKILGKTSAMKRDSCTNAVTQTYTFSGTNVTLDVLLPSNNKPPVHECDERVFLEFSIAGAKMEEEINSCQTFCLLESSGSIHFTIYKSMALDFFWEPRIVQNICIYTNQGKLHLHWSPITQWFITSAVKQVGDIIKYYVNKMPRIVSKKPPSRTNLLTNIKISSNDTIVQANATLGGTTFCNVCAENLLLEITNRPDTTWNKPDICCDVGELVVKLNDKTSALVTTSSFHFSDTSRRASLEEIDLYWRKKNIKIEGEDLLVTGECGVPLLERFELTFGDITRVDMPPETHLGKLIEDIVQTEKSVKEGLFVSGIIKKGVPSQRKYQLMDIHFNIPMLDANFLEKRPSKRFSYSKLPADLLFGNIGDLSLLNRWRFHIKNLSVMIKRNIPPSITQDQLRELDEDKSRIHRYGPMIQGGFFSLKIDHVMCVLHPLNMALPLGDIRNMKLTGLIYLAALHPQTKGIAAKRKVCVPVKYHYAEKQAIEAYDYGVILESDAAPAKIYYDAELSSDDVKSNYGPIVNAAIPALVQITQRFIPSPPFVDKRYNKSKDSSPSLSAWDNMRHQFHGKFSFKVNKVTFRWLLDAARNYNWSIQLTTNNFHFYHSTGLFGLTLNDSILTVPSLSYHLMKFGDHDFGSTYFSGTMEMETGERTFKRHSLLFLPELNVQFQFEWQVPFPKVNHSSRHHTPFLVEENGWPNSICPMDHFSNFRSEGVKMKFEIELDKSEDFSTWVALRGDVLPWLTHKLPSCRMEDVEEQSDNEGEELKINGVEIDVNVSDLHIVAWFDEQAEFLAERNIIGQEIVKGVYLTIPKVCYLLDNVGRNRIDIKGVQAALLDIDYNDFTCPPGCETQHHCWSSTQWNSFQHPCEYEESKNINSFRTFAALYHYSRRTNCLDYLLLVDKINILDISLEEILNSGDLGIDLHSFSATGSGETNALQKSAPWTVLVAEMKLLWTLKIRDRVLQIVKDILYAINLVRVNARGTPQLMTESCAQMIDNVHMEETDHSIEVSIKTKKKSEQVCVGQFDEDASHESATAAGDILKVDVTSKDSFTSQRDKASGEIMQKYIESGEMTQKSHLAYLLSDETDQITPQECPSPENEVVESSNLMKMILDSNAEDVAIASDSSSCQEIERAATIPTFDLHLSNPQIQFHSEKTRGSVIISMLGAYIEMKMFLQLFCKDEDFEAEDFRVETLLRRTEFLYILYRMELYSLSNSVDLDVGLQWLGTKQVGKRLVDCKNKSVRKQGHDGSASQRHERSFPPDLKAHETKVFTLPLLCQKIMDPSTFTTLQRFHRPPIDLTKEELEETILKKSISSLTTTDNDNKKSSRAIDYLELFIDELSFFLDSHQFSTTLDVIRNVLLEPLQPERKRFYNENISKLDTKKEKNLKTAEINAQGKSEASSKMEEAIRQWDQQASKKGREYLRDIANDLLSEIEEKQGSDEPSIRRIQYTLCKAKWKIASPDSINDAVVTFTTFKGLHDFTADGSVNSQITLEDFHVKSTKPGEESLRFEDPTIIVKTMSGVQSSPFMKNPYEFGAAKFQNRSQIPAIAVRMDALPRTVDGLTMYKHIEANVFPGVNHSIIVQLTKSLTKSFVNYFLGDGNRHIEFINHDLKTTSGTSAPKNRLRLESDSSSEAFETSSHSGSDMTRSSSNFRKFSNGDGKEKTKLLLLGSRGNRRKKKMAPKKTKSNRQQDDQNIEIKHSVYSNASQEEENKPEKSQQSREIVFVKLWRIGPINIDLSITGFGRIVNLSNQGVLVPDFRKAYKIGASNHLIKKLVKHFIASLLSNSFDILRNKLGGNKNQKSTVTDDFNVGLGRVLSDVDEVNECEEEGKTAIMFLTTPSLQSRNHNANARRRLYTK